MGEPSPELQLIGWPEDGPTVQLDHREFSYAGKFVMSNTGKAVAREDGDVVAAIAFNEDRTDSDALWIRYVTVRADRRGEGIGPRLVRFVVDAADQKGYQTVRIAVNNPFAFQGLQKAGFRFTGERTGIAELVLERPADSRPDPDPEGYREALDVFADRDLEESERSFLAGRREAGPPDGR